MTSGDLSANRQGWHLGDQFLAVRALSRRGPALAAVRRRREPFGGNIQPAPDALRREQEMSRAAKPIGYKLGNNAPAVTRVARNSHTGAAGLTPFDGQGTEHIPIRCEVPANRNLPLPFGKRLRILPH